MERTVLLEASLAHEIDEQYALQKGSGKITLPVNSKQEVQKYKETIQKKVEKGYLVLVSLYDGVKKGDFSPIPFLERGALAIDHHASLDPELEDGRSIAELFHLDDTTLEQLYHLLFPLFEDRFWQEASDALFLLTLLSPENPTFLHALGNIEYEFGRYDEARKLYAAAFLMNPDNSVLLHEVLDCCEKLGDNAGKEECLKLLGGG